MHRSRFDASRLPSLDRVTALTFAALAGLTVVRIAGLLISRMELDVEEAQYWAWSLQPALGYFSKPPLIAWIIGAAERVCGSSEACLRVPAPLLWFATSAVLFALTRRLYGARTAMWSALLFALAPGIVFSARLITTDVPLMFCWSVALYALVRLRESRAWGWAVLLGGMLGLGLLAKYAMIYFVACALLYAALDPAGRRVILSARGLLALLLAALILAPNLAWNATHGFQTFAHVQENVAGRGLGASLLDCLSFVAGQVGIMGPILLAAFVARLFGYGRTNKPAADRLLLTFSAGVLIPLLLYALATPAKANWTAPAYVGGIPLVTASLVQLRREGLLRASLAIGLLTQVALLTGDAFAKRVRLPFYPGREPYARVLGWADLARAAEQRARAIGATTVVTTTRHDAALFGYYLRKTGLPVVVWSNTAYPSHYFEWTSPLRASTPGPLVLLAPWPMRHFVEQAFTGVYDLGPIGAMTGRTSTRVLFAYGMAAPRETLRPLQDYLPRP